MDIPGQDGESCKEMGEERESGISELDQDRHPIFMQ